MSAQTKRNRLNLAAVKVEIPESKNKNKITPLTLEEQKVLSSRSHEKVIFSFSFLDLDNKLFNLGSMSKRQVPICGEWFITLITTLTEISKLTPNELKNLRNFYDFHPHDWDKTNDIFDFTDEFLKQVDGVQFRLGKSKGRVHGFMIGNRFYIVWLDPHHNLNPSDKHGGEKVYMKPKNCFDLLNEEIIRLQCEVKNLEDENLKLYEELTAPS